MSAIKLWWTPASCNYCGNIFIPNVGEHWASPLQSFMFDGRCPYCDHRNIFKSFLDRIDRGNIKFCEDFIMWAITCSRGNPDNLGYLTGGLNREEQQSRIELWHDWEKNK